MDTAVCIQSKILWIVPRLFLLPESTHLNIASHGRGESMRARVQGSTPDRDDDARFALRQVVYATLADLAENGPPFGSGRLASLARVAQHHLSAMPDRSIASSGWHAPQDCNTVLTDIARARA